MASRRRSFLSADKHAGQGEQNLLQPSIENNFIGGLKTEHTGLNFPENACTDMQNTIVSLIGESLNREGINFETNSALTLLNSGNNAINTYKWNNVGGDGATQVLVLQVGGTLYFFQSTNATIASPLSTTKLASTVTLSAFTATGSTFDNTVECQFSDGNGYLYVFNTNMDPIYCTFTAGVITANLITIQIRDFVGIPEASADNFRPITLVTEHSYNLQNQGWTQGGLWTAFSTNLSQVIGSGTLNWTITTGLTITLGTQVNIDIWNEDTRGNPSPGSDFYAMTGTITAYTSGTGAATFNITSASGFAGNGIGYASWKITPINIGLVNTWFTAEGNYPSNADVWWQFKDSSGNFLPGTTVPKVTLGSGPAPKGFYIMSAFRQTRSSISTIAGITDIITNVRPKTGTWFQGRVWYTGVDATFAAAGDVPYTTWTENIYFSQIVQTPAQFGRCYQTNDPTSETLFDLLPSDGGVIVIQGSGSIYKLVPIQTGMLVFAANGVWFITGSAGLGFTANDYTITKISSVRCFSSTSFVYDHNGYPFFWNEEGIYFVHPGKDDILYRSGPYGHGGLEVQDMTLGTIRTYYSNIPLGSKKYARGDYNPLTFVITWLYRSTDETGPNFVQSRHEFDSALNFNLGNKAFYPYSFPSSKPKISGVNYISSPGGSTAPEPTLKYLTQAFDIPSQQFKWTFAEEDDNVNWVDFHSYDGIGTPYTSYFITGYKLHGKSIAEWQPLYVYMFSRNAVPTQYFIESRWDYASSGASSRWSAIQKIVNNTTNFGMVFRRHKLRGYGIVMQMKVTAVPGHPFDIMGWALMDAISGAI